MAAQRSVRGRSENMMITEKRTAAFPIGESSRSSDDSLDEMSESKNASLIQKMHRVLQTSRKSQARHAPLRSSWKDSRMASRPD